jgi:hypothetical protein
VKAAHIPDEETLHKAMATAPTAESKLAPLLQGKKEYPGGVKYDVVTVKKPRQYAYQRIAAEKVNK